MDGWAILSLAKPALSDIDEKTATRTLEIRRWSWFGKITPSFENSPKVGNQRASSTGMWHSAVKLASCQIHAAFRGSLFLRLLEPMTHLAMYSLTLP